MEISKEKIKDIEKYTGHFHIDVKRQEKVYDEIRENAKGDFDFFITTFLFLVTTNL